MDMPEELLQPSLISQRFRGFLPVVIDVETGGFNSGTDALLEIAAVTLEMDSQGYLQIKESFTAKCTYLFFWTVICCTLIV